jgi:hypothetical protein
VKSAILNSDFGFGVRFRLRPADGRDELVLIGASVHGTDKLVWWFGETNRAIDGRLRFEGKWRRSIFSDERMLVGKELGGRRRGHKIPRPGKVALVPWVA